VKTKISLLLKDDIFIQLDIIDINCQDAIPLQALIEVYKNMLRHVTLPKDTGTV